jgi:cysteinyl-tRNA synthetase
MAKGYNGREVRYALMRVHYRAPLNFTWEGMEEARQSLGRIDEWLQRLREKAGTEVAAETSPNEEFPDALDDDLNISAALGILFESIRETNRRLDAGELSPVEARSWLDWWNRIDKVLALSPEQTELPAEIAKLAEARVQARLAKDWRKSDELRDELSARGWEARDTKDGQKLTRRAGV